MSLKYSVYYLYFFFCVNPVNCKINFNFFRDLLPAFSVFRDFLEIPLLSLYQMWDDSFCADVCREGVFRNR